MAHGTSSDGLLRVWLRGIVRRLRGAPGRERSSETSEGTPDHVATESAPGQGLRLVPSERTQPPARRAVVTDRPRMLGMPRRRLPRRVTGVPHSGGYSLFVRFMKVLLPTIAAGLIGLMLIWPQFDLKEETLGQGLLDIHPEDARHLRMTKPRFVGSDDAGRPFTVIAEEATQASVDADVVNLTAPQGDVTMQDGAWLALRADHGIYDRGRETLDLTGDVVLIHDAGYEFLSEEARIDLAGGTAEGDLPVLGRGPMGEVRGQGFRIFDGGDRVFVLGRSRMVLVGGAPPAPGKEEP